MQAPIAFYINNWLQNHPAVFRLLQMLLWATNHPIISLIILVFVMAIARNLIKAIGGILEIIGRELIQAPLNLFQFVFKLTVKSLSQVGDLAVNQLIGKKNTELTTLPPATSASIQNDKQQRLAEISSRLEAIQKEQNELLKEAASILVSEKINIEF